MTGRTEKKDRKKVKVLEIEEEIIDDSQWWENWWETEMAWEKEEEND